VQLVLTISWDQYPTLSVQLVILINLAESPFNFQIIFIRMKHQVAITINIC